VVSSASASIFVPPMSIPIRKLMICGVYGTVKIG
jgi:hypothetical protein